MFLIHHLGSQQDFIESRRRGLERFLNRVAKHPVLGCTKILYEFLTASGDKVTRVQALTCLIMITRVLCLGVAHW